MTQLLPDWMFAAIGIGAWELFDLMARHWHMPVLRWGGVIVAIICALVLVIRYITRFVHRMKHPEVPDPDEWKQY